MAAAADELLRRVQRDDVSGLDGVAGFVGGLAVDAHCAGEDEALGLLPTGGLGAFDEGLIQTGRCHWWPQLRAKPKRRQCQPKPSGKIATRREVRDCSLA